MLGSQHACLLGDSEHDVELLVRSAGLYNVLHDFQYGGHCPFIIAPQGSGAVCADDMSVHHPGIQS